MSKYLDSVYKNSVWIVIILSMIGYFAYKVMRFDGSLESTLNDWQSWVHVLFVIFLNVTMVSGAYDNATHNSPISISPGNHSIKVEFNGMILEQDIFLLEGETEVITFIFDRTIFDHRAYLNSQGYHLFTREGLFHGGPGDYMFYMEEVCPDHTIYPHIVLWSALHTIDCVVSYSISCEFFISANKVITNKYGSTSIIETYPPYYAFRRSTFPEKYIHCMQDFWEHNTVRHIP